MKRLLAVLLASICISFAASAQLTGPLSGTLGPGTYSVVGDISVVNGDSLTIAPGTIFLFEGQYEFDIDGYLYAVGNEIDSVKFMPSIVDSTWGGLNFNSSADDFCMLGYCLITGGYAAGSSISDGGGGILCDHSNPTIANCTINGNSTVGFGAGIYCYYSSPAISNCAISDNSAQYLQTGGSGAGICCYHSSPAISDCIIKGNSAVVYGGGISSGDYSDPIIENCSISDNSGICGGGVHFYGPGATITECTIERNSCEGYGGGISCLEASPTITNCTISGNWSGDGGGGIECGCFSNPLIEKCTISENSSGRDGGGIHCFKSSSPSVILCTINRNSAEGWSGGGFTPVSPI